MTLAPGLIFDIAAQADLALRGTGDKRTCKCPFHKDRTASAFLSAANVFFCSVCTPSAGWPAKRFAEALGIPWNPRQEFTAPVVVQPRKTDEPEFTPEDARATWTADFARARDDERVEEDQPVYDYLIQRGLLEALELGAFGILPPKGIHAAIARWPARGYRIIAPLFDSQGAFASVQARSILPEGLKTMNVKGTRVAETLFADRRGQRVLAGEPAKRIVYGEGLTDMLALAITSPWPVLAAPGTSNAAGSVGTWAFGADVLLALDNDGAGEEAVMPVTTRLYEYGAARVRRIVWPRKLNDACAVLEARGDVGLGEFLERVGNGVAA